MLVMLFDWTCITDIIQLTLQTFIGPRTFVKNITFDILSWAPFENGQIL